MDFDKVLYLLTHIDEAEVDGDELMSTASQMSVDEDEFMAIVEANSALMLAADVNRTDDWSSSPLHLAAMHGHLDICTKLVG